MKVVSSKKMSQLESLAYSSGSSERDFMEEAGSGVALIAYDYVERFNLNRVVTLLCGKGNNAGDAYVAGINLLHLDYEVHAVVPFSIEESSILCRSYHARFLAEGGRISESLSEFPPKSLIIDGIFGTGFHGLVREPFASLIRMANDSKLPILAIDIPSGLDGETGQVDGEAIIASETAFLGLPKTGFFLQDGWNHVGKLHYVDFGLPKKYIKSCEADLMMLTEEIIKPYLPVIKRNRHKYQAGYVIGLSGSPGMSGAAILSCTSSLRGGAGIVKLFHPDGMQNELASSPYELIKVPYHYDNFDHLIDMLNLATSVFIGPGIGLRPEARKLVREVLPNLKKPCVIDADALTILAEEEILLPSQAILTPHLGEMMRLLKLTEKPQISMDFLQTCKKYAEAHGVTLVLKGGPTFIFDGSSLIKVNSTGDPGMATAGSGDVLTGLIAALLAQGIAPAHAAPLGVFLHGLAGEHAAEEMTSYGVIASDIIYHYPEAFKLIDP